jgi:hypothetical protein
LFITVYKGQVKPGRCISKVGQLFHHRAVDDITMIIYRCKMQSVEQDMEAFFEGSVTVTFWRNRRTMKNTGQDSWPQMGLNVAPPRSELNVLCNEVSHTEKNQM